MRRIVGALPLAAIAVLAAVLRFSGLAVPSLWLDEILDYDVVTQLIHEPLWRWLTGIASEHGPLFFASELAGRFSHTPELAARVAPAVFGVLTIVVAGYGCRLLGAAESLTFALLLAGSPLAVYYSREARPYALLILLATCMLALLLRARDENAAAASAARPRVSTGGVFLLILTLFATSGAAPLLVATALTAGLAFLISRERFYSLFAIAASISAAAIPLVYRRAPANAALGFRPLTTRFFQRLLESFSISALDTTTVHRAAYVVAALALIGAVALVIRDRLRGTIVIGMAILPVAASLAALWRLQHWYAVRYLTAALPAYLLLTAIGITSCLRLLFRGRLVVAIPVVALLTAGFILREGWQSARTESYRKLNWRVIAATIHDHAHARDAVVTTNDWSYVCLDFYLRQLPPRVRLISAAESVSRAASVVAHNDPVWIVSAGFHRTGAIGDWSCQYPVVMASPLESFRLHYAPGLRHLLLNRLTSSDTRALVARYPSHILHLGADSEFFLSGGWYGPEGALGDFSRWSGAQPVSAMLVASGVAAHRLLVRMMPLDDRGASPQIASISLNGAPMAPIALAKGWRDYSFDVPRQRWRDGINFLSISFSRAEAPATIDPRSVDHRLLAARFNLIAVAPLTATNIGDSLSELTQAFRINEPGMEMIDENSAWRGRPKQISARPAFLARVGIDPVRQVAAANIAETVAYDSECLSDSDFLKIAYATILGRPIDAGGKRYFSDALKKKESRVGVVQALVQSEEFRALH